MIALILILFRDGLEVEAGDAPDGLAPAVSQAGAGDAAHRGLVAVVTHTLTDLGWTESFLVGALLSPTDPVLSSTVVNNPRVPAVIRHSLNLESGLNDGLALPAVLAFTAAAEQRRRLRLVGVRAAGRRASALATGLVVAFVGPRLMPRETRTATAISAHQKALYALGVAFAAYGTAVLPARGQRLHRRSSWRAIALGIWRPDIGDCFEARSEDVIEVVKLGVFLVFGAILTFDASSRTAGRRWRSPPSRCSSRARSRSSPRWPAARRWTPRARRSWPGSARRAWPR